MKAVTLDGLQRYDGKIKDYIAAACENPEVVVIVDMTAAHVSMTITNGQSLSAGIYPAIVTLTEYSAVNSNTYPVTYTIRGVLTKTIITDEDVQAFTLLVNSVYRSLLVVKKIQSLDGSGNLIMYGYLLAQSYVDSGFVKKTTDDSTDIRIISTVQDAISPVAITLSKDLGIRFTIGSTTLTLDETKLQRLSTLLESS